MASEPAPGLWPKTSPSWSCKDKSGTDGPVPDLGVAVHRVPFGSAQYLRGPLTCLASRTIIATALPGRSDNGIKNRFNSTAFRRNISLGESRRTLPCPQSHADATNAAHSLRCVTSATAASLNACQGVKPTEVPGGLPALVLPSTPCADEDTSGDAFASPACLSRHARQRQLLARLLAPFTESQPRGVGFLELRPPVLPRKRSRPAQPGSGTGPPPPPPPSLPY